MMVLGRMRIRFKNVQIFGERKSGLMKIMMRSKLIIGVVCFPKNMKSYLPQNNKNVKIF